MRRARTPAEVKQALGLTRVQEKEKFHWLYLFMVEGRQRVPRVIHVTWDPMVRVICQELDAIEDRLGVRGTRASWP